MADRLTNQAYAIAVNNAEEQLVECSRSFEDCQRHGDANGMAYAWEGVVEAQAKLDRITGGDQQQQQQELLDSERAYLDNRARLGDNWKDHPQDFVNASARALAAGFQRGSPEYFSVITNAVETAGDGRSPVLTEKTAAEICGLSAEEYANGAARVRALKRQGYYQRD